MSVASINRKIKRLEKELADLQFKKKTTRISDELAILNMSIKGVEDNLVKERAKLITATAKENIKKRKRDEKK